MYTHPQQGSSKEDVLRLRQAAGAYLRQLREAAGLTQRALGAALDMEYYTFIAQIESGRGRVPPAQMRDWARVLGVAPRAFAINMMRFYDPLSFELIFPDGVDAQVTGPGEGADDLDDLERRIDTLEGLLARRNA